MNSKLSLLAIVSIAAIMITGAVAPAIANDPPTQEEIEKEQQVAIDKANEAIDVACEKILKEIEILEDKGIPVPRELKTLAIDLGCLDICERELGEQLEGQKKKELPCLVKEKTK